MNPRRTVAIAFATIISVIGLVEGYNVTVDHLNTSTFPDHAQFHAALGGMYLLGLSLLLLLLAWGPVRQGAPAAVPPFVVCVIVIPAGFLAAVAIVPGGSPGQPHTGLALGALGLGLVAVALMVKREAK